MTTNTVRMNRELKLFIPISLFLGEEDKGPTTLFALPPDIIVVSVQHRGPVLTRSISNNGCSGNQATDVLRINPMIVVFGSPCL